MGQLSHSTRIQIIGFYFMGLTNEQISIALECDERTVENWINRYNETGDIKALHRSGRPRVTTRADEEDIVAAVVADPFENAVNINKNKGSAVSDTTIRRRLREHGFGCRSSAQAERLTVTHKLNRNNFALQYNNFEGWGRTLFTDESTFLTGAPHKTNVWREIGTRYDEHNIQIIQNSGRASVSVWGCMTRQGLGPIYRVHRTFNRFQYLDVLEILVLPYIEEIFPDGNYTFLQDRSPIHTSLICQEWFEENMQN